MQGVILKGIGSFYTVLTDCGAEYVCKARGRFRKEGISPVVGDKVEFTVDENTGNGFIARILERKNVLVRPAVANLDKLIIVMSASVPKPDFFLTDKLIATCEMHSITPVLVINKCDDKEAEVEITRIRAEYDCTGYRIHEVSAMTGKGIETLRSEMAGCVSCFAGQSAVGKSSILNAVTPELCLETGELSRKTDRGKHTTRHAQLWRTDNGGAFLDTPGFSLVEFFEMDPKLLSGFYIEMRTVENMCRFTGCMHINEPDCAVKLLVDEGKLSKGRYERYKVICGELEELYKHRYDKTKFHDRKGNT